VKEWLADKEVLLVTVVIVVAALVFVALPILV
jgi:hypothetical protein